MTVSELLCVVDSRLHIQGLESYSFHTVILEGHEIRPGQAAMSRNYRCTHDQDPSPFLFRNLLRYGRKANHILPLFIRVSSAILPIA